MSFCGGPPSYYRWLNTHVQMLLALKGQIYKWVTNCRVLHDERKTYVNDDFRVLCLLESRWFLRIMKPQDARVICFVVTAYLCTSLVAP